VYRLTAMPGIKSLRGKRCTFRKEAAGGRERERERERERKGAFVIQMGPVVVRPGHSWSIWWG